MSDSFPIRSTHSLKPEANDPEDTVAQIASREEQPIGLPTSPNRYELLQEIAHGGMGVVYAARDRVLNRDVAIKVLQERFEQGSAAARRFDEEAQVTGQLQHPCIPPIHDLGILADGRPFLAMKLIKGHTLGELLKERASPAAGRGRFLAVFDQVCQAVAYAHARGIIHRDLKPANVMVGAFGEVQLMDWGLSKVLTGEKASAGDNRPIGVTTILDPRAGSDGSETQAGSILGTLAFMPPEQAIGAVDRVDRRADVFGLGAILCMILTGEPPFVADTNEEIRILAAQGKVAAAFARLDVCGAEPELVKLAKHCLAPDPVDRPADAGVVAIAVTQLRTETEERARRAEVEGAEAAVREAERRKRRKVQLALGIAVGLTVGLILFGWWWRESLETGRANEQSRRRLETERDVSAALQEAEGFLNESLTLTEEPARWEAALTKARAAVVRAGSLLREDATDELRARVASATDRLNRDDYDRRFIDRLDDLYFRFQEKDDFRKSSPVVAAQYAAVFKEYGLDPDLLTVSEMATRIREHPRRDALRNAIYEWRWQAQNTPRYDYLNLLMRGSIPVGDVAAIEWHDAVVARDTKRVVRLSEEVPIEQLSSSAAYRMFKDLSTLQAKLASADFMRRALRKYPADFRLHFQFAVFHFLGRLGDSAARHFQAAIALRPESANACQILGNHLMEIGQLDDAELWFRRGVDIRPNDENSHYLLSLVLYRQRARPGALTEVIHELEECIRLGSTRKFEELGSVKEEIGDREGAIVCYRKMIELFPTYMFAHYHLALALRKSNQLEAAIEEYDTALKMTPKFVEGHNELGICYFHLGRFPEAEREYRAAIALDGKYALAHYNLSFVLFAVGKFSEASKELLTATKIDPRLKGMKEPAVSSDGKK